MRNSQVYLMILICAVLFACGCSEAPPETAEELVARSVKVHGGDKLTSWNTMTIVGTVPVQDLNVHNARYSLMADRSGKLRAEIDHTVDKGRVFTDYFLNDGIAWQRRNLIPWQSNAAGLQIWLNQLDGIKYYADNADELFMKDDDAVIWKESPNVYSFEFSQVDETEAYVVAAVIAGDTTNLYFDKSNLRFIQEGFGNRKRVFRDFQNFGGVLHPTRINEVTSGRRGEYITAYRYSEIKYNVEIEPYMFTEDMPNK